MTGDVKIREKSGQEMKQEILGMIYDYMLELREMETCNPLNNYLTNTKIEALYDIHKKVLDISPTKNGG